MVLIQLDIDQELDKKLKHYMVDHNLNKKDKAIKEVLKKYFTIN